MVFHSQEYSFPDLCQFPDDLPFEDRLDLPGTAFPQSEVSPDYPLLDPAPDSLERLDWADIPYLDAFPPASHPVNYYGHVDQLSDVIDLSIPAIMPLMEPNSDWATLNDSWLHPEPPGPLHYLSTAQPAISELPGLVDSGSSSSQSTTSSSEHQASPQILDYLLSNEMACQSSPVHETLPDSSLSNSTQPIRCHWGTCTNLFYQVTDLRKHVRIHTVKATACKWADCVEPAHATVKHLDKHIKPYECRYFGCIHSAATSRDLKRHKLSHGLKPGTTVFFCPLEGCSYHRGGEKKPFPRVDNAARHIKNKHSDSKEKPIPGVWNPN